MQKRGRPSTKPPKPIPKFMKRDLRERSIFAIRSMQKPRFGGPKQRNSDAEIEKMTWEQAGTKIFQSSRTQKN